jgi:hypothetical protein
MNGGRHTDATLECSSRTGMVDVPVSMHQQRDVARRDAGICDGAHDAVCFVWGPGIDEDGMLIDDQIGIRKAEGNLNDAHWFLFRR